MLHHSSSRIWLSSIHTQRRFKMTGFNVFVRETQQKHRLLKAKTLYEGSKKNMKIMSSLWRKLPKTERIKYNHRAFVEQLITPRDFSKKYSSFNMVMQVLAQDKALLNAGDERFVSLLASRTARALSTSDLQKLMRKLNVEMTNPVVKKTLCRHVSCFHRMMFPSMRYFSSFTEMQHAVAPTRQILYISICRLLSGYHISQSGDSDLKAKFNSLEEQVKALFNPISKEESPSFEMFCVRNCAGFDEERFNILILFAQFRQIIVRRVAASNVDTAVFRSMLAEERCHDPAYFKVRRILARARECRSSDCSTFIYSRTPEDMVVPPQSYSIHKGFDEVDVATRLAETRQCQSVYDDILDRAAVLRPKENQKKLEMYNVKNMRRELVTHEASAVEEPNKQGNMIFLTRLQLGAKLSKIPLLMGFTSKQSKSHVMLENHQPTTESNAEKLGIEPTSLTSDENHIANATDVKARNRRKPSIKYREVLDTESHYDQIKEFVSSNNKSDQKRKQDLRYTEDQDNFPTDDLMHMLDDDAENWDSLDLLPQGIEHESTVSVQEHPSSLSKGVNIDNRLSKKSSARRILRSARVQDDVMLDPNHSIIFKHKHKPTEQEFVSAFPHIFPALGGNSGVRLLKKTTC